MKIMTKFILLFLVSITTVSCSKNEVLLPPEQTTVNTPQEAPAPEVNDYVLPYPSILNPSNHKRIVRIENGSIWYGSRVVDTTVYQYNSQGTIEKEYFTQKIGASPTYKYIVKTYTVYPEFLGNVENAHVIESTIYPSGRNYKKEYYCDLDGRVIRTYNNESRINEYFTYDELGRLSEIAQSLNLQKMYTKRFTYYSKSESNLQIEYYTEHLFSGNWDEQKVPTEETEYFYSQKIKNRNFIPYPYNFGKSMSDYQLERVVKKGATESGEDLIQNFTFELNDEGLVEKSQYLYRDNSFYKKYFYN